MEKSNKLKSSRIIILAFVFLVAGVVLVELGQNNLVARAEQKAITKQELDEHVKNLEKLYTDQIEAYRAAERQYKLALVQYQQLQTLSAKEEAVRSASQALSVRSDVLISYFELLHSRMVASDGMSSADKEKLSPQLIAMIEKIKQDKANVGQASSVEQVNQLAKDYQTLYKELVALSTRTQFLLDLAQLNATKEKAEDIFSRLKTKQEELPLSEIKRAERGRAYQQIEELFGAIDQQVITQNQLALGVDGEFEKQRSKPTIILSDIESNLLKVLDYLKELANIL